MNYEIVQEPQFEKVLEYLRENFHDEPLNVAIGFVGAGQKCELFEGYNLSALQDGMSIVAVDPENEKISGVVLNGIARPGEVENELEKLKTVDNLKYRQLFGILYRTNKDAELFEKYDLDKIFDIRILSVDNKYRGRGIAKILFGKSIELAKKNGFKVVKTDATSFFTQKIAESFGFEVEKTVVYADFMDENGEKVYKTEPPHLEYKIMSKIIN